MNLGMRGADLPAWLGIALLLVAAVLLYAVRGIVPPFLAAIILAYLFHPAVRWMEHFFRLSRLGAVLLLFLVAMSPLSALVFWVLPPLIREGQGLAAAVPGMANTVFEQFFGGNTASLGVAITAQAAADLSLDLARGLVALPAESTAAARLAIEFFASVLLTLVLLIYLLMDRERLVQSALGLLPAHQRARTRLAIAQVDRTLASYLWGLLALVVFELAAAWLALGALYRLPFALPVALTVSLLGLVPFVGPFAAGLFVALVALGVANFEMAVGAVVFYFILRWFEHEVIMPHLLDREAAAHPTVAIFGVLAGTALAGLFGALVSLALMPAAKSLLANWQAAGAADETTLLPEISRVAAVTPTNAVME